MSQMLTTSPSPILGDLLGADRMCSRTKSGAAVISERTYNSSGEFEFKIRPSLSDGVITVLGLADDSVNAKAPFLQVMFDTLAYTNTSFAVAFGGAEKLESFSFMVNVSEVFPYERLLQT